MQVNGNVMAVVDCMCCFANNALQFKYKKPILQDDFILDIKDSRHPVIEQNLPAGEPYIAIVFTGSVIATDHYFNRPQHEW